MGLRRGLGVGLRRGLRRGLGVGLRRGLGVGLRRGLGVGRRRGLGVGRRRGLGVGWRRGLGVGRRRGLGVGWRRGLGVGWRRGLGVGRRWGLGVGWRRGLGVACEVGASPVMVPAVSFSSGTMSFAVPRIESSKASREAVDRDREVREPTLSLRALVLGEVEAAPRIESSKASREAMDRDPLPAGRLLVLGSGTLGGLLLSGSRGVMASREVREPTLSLRALVLGSMFSARVVFILLLLGSRGEVVRRELMVAARLRRGVVFGLSLSGSRGVMASRELREPTLSLPSVNVSTPPVSLAGRASR